MSVIRVLDPGLSNRIAAGEVVERPASVVKELIENSIDSGAGHIRVFVEEAGMKTIRVLDDGCGMDREDAQLALRRHATSKIASERDLFRIRTLGFRGEALPSIAAVSRMVLKTRRKEDDTGTAVEIEGGRILRVSDTAMAPGTDVVVRDLFYNTPARLKYVKSLQTEAAHVMDTVSKAALAHPEIAFVLETEGRRVLATPGDGKLIHAVAALYGREVAGKCLPFDEQGPELRVWGLTALPEVNRAGRSHVLFFVNGRPVKNTALTAAVLGVYAGRLPIHRYPVAFIHIHLDPGLVDPNVHPSKLEVRFSEEKDVVHTVEQALRRALESARAIPRLTLPRSGSKGFSGSDKEARPLEVATAREEQGATRQERQIQFHWPASTGRSPGSPGFLVREKAFQALQPVTGREEGQKDETQEPPDKAMALPVSGNEEPASTDHAGRFPRVPELRAVAQVLNLYIVAEAEDSVFLIDQHAAHERILYERFSKQVYNRMISPMPLLVPVTVELTVAEQKRLTPYLDLMQEYGLTIEPFGGNTVVVRTVPDVWDGLDVAALTRDLITEWVEEDPQRDPRRILQDKIITRACRGAIKAGQRLSLPEMQALCDQLRELDNPFTCPHGRPTVLQWTRRDLDKQFQRIQG